jgi:DNA polymerase-3 subunit delta'
VHWLRPASKSRVITAEQMRDLLAEIHLKPSAGHHKVAIIAGADRLNTSAANIFLKTLEEPPTRSVILLLSTEPQRLLETITSRCLRLRLGQQAVPQLAPEMLSFLEDFAREAAAGEKSLISRYRLLSILLVRLAALRDSIDEHLTGQSPLGRYEEVDKGLKDKWEDELAAAVESEYRRQRSELLRAVQLWLRDVWLLTLGMDPSLLALPSWARTSRVAQRLDPTAALANLDTMEQTQRQLHTNVQEALALEVCLLKLQL